MVNSMIMRKTLFFINALLALFLLAGPAYSSDWLRVDDTAGGEKNFIDMESIKYNRPLVNFRARNIDRKEEATITSYVINCQNGTGAIREIVIYDSNDLPVKSYSFKENRLQWSKITPRSFMRIYLKLVCEGRGLE